MAILFLCSCSKQNEADDSNCDNINNITLFSNSPVNIGQTIHFGTQEVGGYRVYYWNGPNFYQNQYPSDSITSAELKHEGWYYLSLSNPTGSCQKIDSIYIDVKPLQGTPPCTIPANTTTYSSLSNDSYSNVQKYIESTYSQKALVAGVSSNMTIYFHTHWRTAEPENGIYTTINSPLFDQTDMNYNKVFITTTKNSIYWSSYANQNVYISHIGSKLQVRFCNLSMSGYNGTSYTTVASGNVVEQ